jgi:hypothetical protein
MAMLPVRNAWFNRDNVRFVDSGPTPMRNAHVYSFIHGFTSEGEPIRIEGQYNIADTIPGDPLYSPLWLVNYVLVSQKFVPNSVRSEREIFQKGYPIQVAGNVSNCPVVRKGTTAPGYQTVPSWYKGQKIYYIDFGLVPFRSANFYFFAEKHDKQIVLLQDQYPILDSIPGSSDYSPVWRINYVFPPSDYKPNTIRSEDKLLTSGFQIRSTKKFLNCPVITE